MAREGPTLDDLRQALKQKQFSPVYLFHGEEDLLAEEATELVIAAALSMEEREFNLDVMYGSEADARDIASHASSFPMMAERRVVVVRELDRVANKDLLSGYLEQPSETTCLILQTVKADMRRKPYLLAKRHGMIIEFRPLYDSQIPGWIAGQVSTQGRSIRPDAARMLATYVGQSLREIRNEIEKLLLYAGERREILLEDVQAVVGASREYNIFELQKVVGARQVNRAVQIIDRMLEAGESPVMIVVMLTRFFSMLWRLQDMRRRGVSPAGQASEMGLATFQMRELTDAAVQHDSSDCERAFSALVEADEQLKSTSTDPKLILEVLIVHLTDRLPVIRVSTPIT
jgi:DNA polymerase III subunit delta